MSGKALKTKAAETYDSLNAKYPDAHIELNFSNPLELTVATVLSAQCTDSKVNQVTETLFDKYKKPQDYLEVPEEELQQDIHSTGFYKQKTKSIRGIMQALIDKHGGKVPDTLAELTDLPGIGRKTANVILGNAFNVPGIVVDTHVKRVANRIGLTKHDDPEKIEQDLMELYSDTVWTQLSHVFIFHGRYTCQARKPKCNECPVSNRCDYYAENIDR